MKDWQLFEQECCTYLNSVLKDYPFTFKCSGGSNSNASDIEVMKNNKSVFSIEVKLSPVKAVNSLFSKIITSFLIHRGMFFPTTLIPGK